MGSHVEPMVHKDSVLEEAAGDQYRGSYVAFGKMHWPSFLLGSCVGGMLVYTVWFVQYGL